MSRQNYQQSRREFLIETSKAVGAGLVAVTFGVGCSSPPPAGRRPESVLQIYITSEPSGAEVWSTRDSLKYTSDGRKHIQGIGIVGRTPYQGRVEIHNHRGRLWRRSDDGCSTLLEFAEDTKISPPGFPPIPIARVNTDLRLNFEVRKQGYVPASEYGIVESVAKVGVMKSVGASRQEIFRRIGNRTISKHYVLQPLYGTKPYQKPEPTPQQKEIDIPIQQEDPAENLLKLKELFDKKILTQEEYNEKRKKYIDRL